MGEHVFPSEEYVRDAVATELAADLLERMLDRISRPNHDWIMIAGEAAELSLLAARMAASASVDGDRPGASRPLTWPKPQRGDD
jgi:hypothetical protein